MNVLSHRGPDGRNSYSSDNILLGHVRLAVIDKAGGIQPMTSDNGQFTIVFNGEIYNFKELKSILEKRGVVFKTRSDTEVLLYWLIEFGIDGLKKINGMFAIAFWDKRNRSLLLARDRLGIKPLYFMQDKNCIKFSSEIKALAVLDTLSPNYKAVFQYLTLQNICGEHTAFEGIQRLMPGSWIRWSPNYFSSGKYWNLEFEHKDLSIEDCVERYQIAFNRAIERHLISDVPIGVTLSGGIDSSSVAIAASKILGNGVHTFTGAFLDGNQYDERPLARLISQKMNAYAHEILISEDDFIENIDNVIYHLEEPCIGTGSLPQYMVAKEAAKCVKVILTGHGGDELFSGYQVFKSSLIKDKFSNREYFSMLKILTSLKRGEIARVAYFLLYPFMYEEVSHGMFIMIPQKKWADTYDNGFIKSLNGYNPFNAYQEISSKVNETNSEKQIRLYTEMYLPTLLSQEDRMSMAHSIESRTPLCDNELIDLSAEICAERKLNGSQLKAVPRISQTKNLPNELFTAQKRGFPTPYSHWFSRDPIYSMLGDTLLSKKSLERGIFKKEWLINLVKSAKKNSGDRLFDYANANLISSVFTTELWFNKFID